MSKSLIDYCIVKEIKTIIVGYNKEWKDSIQIGQRVNQKFVSIPYLNLLNMLKYKSVMNGIELIVTEESYTSKCDGLMLEKLCKHSIYSGKRIKRGLFKSGVGKAVNADVNGGFNIMRKKVVDESVFKQIIDRGLLFNPQKIRSIF